MEISEARDFRQNIHELSKKELQDLCRTYGLSPYKTKPNLVNSLISYFKVIDRNLLQEYSIRNSAHISSKRRGTSGPGYVRQHDENDFKLKVDFPHIISFEKSNFTFVREIELSEMSQSQPSGSDSLPKNIFASAVKSTPVPSFEFSVRSDEGINLTVDLNSSPSDWSNRLENGICLCHSFWKGKLQSFCEEHQNLQSSDKQNNSSFLVSGDLDSKMKSDHGNTGSSENTVDREHGDAVFLHPAEDHGSLGLSKTNTLDRENGDAVFLHPAADNGSTGFSKTKPCTVAMDMPTKENKEFPLLIGLNSDADNQIASDPKSSQMDGEAERTDVNDLHARKVKQDSCYKSNLLVDVPTNASKDQYMQPSENCTSINMGNAYSLENPSLVSPVSPVIGAMEIQSGMTCQEQVGLISPSPSNYDKNIVDAVPTVKSRGDGPANLNEVNHNNYVGHKPTSAEELERIGSVNQKAASEKAGRKSEFFVSDRGQKRKRQDIESEKDRASADGRILRSGKRTHGQGLRRRSKRLVSK